MSTPEIIYPDNKQVETVETPETMPAQIQVDAFPVEQIIKFALERGTPIETMERLLAMRKELKAEKAKEAFDAAMSRLQGDLPVIKKTKIVLDKYGKERYRYAPIDAIVEQTKAYIAKHGFSFSITTDQGSNDSSYITAICTVKHELGHYEVSTFRVPIDIDSYMTAPQKVAAALTFAKRYSYCNAFGIMTGDEDNDANKIEEEEKPQYKTKPPTPPAPITPAKVPTPLAAPVQSVTPQKTTTVYGGLPPKYPAAKPLVEKTRVELMRELHVLLKKYGMPHKAFCDAYQVDSMDLISDDLIRKAIMGLRKKTQAQEVWRDPSVPIVEQKENPLDNIPSDFGGNAPVEETPPPENEPAVGASKFRQIAGAAKEKSAAEARIANNIGSG